MAKGNQDDFEQGGSSWNTIEYTSSAKQVVKGSEDEVDIDESLLDEEEPVIDQEAEDFSDIEVEDQEEQTEEEVEEEKEEEEVKDESPTDKKTTQAEKRIKTLIKKIKEVARQKDEEFSGREEELLKEIEQLRGLVVNQGASYADVLITKAQSDVTVAKQKYKQARETLDADEEIKALEELQRAQVNLLKAEELKKKLPTAPKKEDKEGESFDNKRAIKLTNEWLESNPEVRDNPRLQKLVEREAQKVEAAGIYTAADFEYYEAVNKAVNKKLKESNIKYRVQDILGIDLDDEEGDDDEFAALDAFLNEDEPEEKRKMEEVKEKPIVKTKTAPAVGNKVSSLKQRATQGTPAQGTKPARVSLTVDEVRQAQRMGVDPRIVLRQKAYEQGTNTSITGWNSVLITKKNK